ncbi:hypothetical protein Taro_022821 [Colocasia esculenta]|uniref:BED-type domain-containing protein n=1 Tax=Colocasia esculenta TaxID=4460 RepID=A0A843V2L4_COLES|nr:hypothetical protein [Colocasia esculenta]
MASPPVPDIILPLSSQKHDPAWKHCHMIKRGDRTHLRCMYCHKLFSGGGIHRIKEHLACQKGNASSCPKVTTEVRRAMQQSLEGVVMRRRKKQKLAEEVKKLNPVKQLEIDAGQSEADMGLQLVAMPDSVEPEAVQLEKKEEVIPKTHERRVRRAVKASPVPVSIPCGSVSVRSNWGGTVENDQVQVAIGRFLYESGVPLDAVNSVHFQPMVDAIAAAGPGLKIPTYHDIRGWILKNSVKEMKATLEHWRESWARTGCSILADEWTTEMDQTLINFMVYCPEGMMFMKSVDVTQIVTSADALYELLKLVVEEVGVNNVLQVITNNTETHAIAGKTLTEIFPSMFWMPCAARCVVAMLEDIEKLEQVSIIMEHAKSIARFIYNHAEVLNMLRRCTDGKDLVHPYRSPSETNFITLKNIASLKENLCNMVASQDWRNSPYSKKQAGAEMADLICSPIFWSSVTTLVQLTEPLVRVLRMVDSYRRPAMGYIYMGLRHAKEVIKKILKRKKDYMPYLNIIDWRWDKELSRPLHAAGFFLNPQFFYSIKGEVPNEIMSGMLDCIERLVPDAKAQDKINKELALYKNATGDFGRKMAIRARHTLLPAEWWSTYGGGCPNLTRLAIRILSQTCSARGCERSHIPFEQMHSQRKNHLEHQRLNDLIYVQYNLRLQQRQFLKNKQSDPISVDVVDVIDDWIMEKSELFTGEDDDSSWMDLMQPVAGGFSSESMNDDDDDPFTVGLDDGVLDVAADDDDDDEDEDQDDGCREEENDVKQEIYDLVKEEN